MKCRFIHASDIHLGYEQYNLPARADDFARAYLLGVVEHALAVQADFVLIAGDLFHRANTDAWTLRQATAGLASLRQAGIPVIAIEGNHDAQHYHKHLSWMEFLCDQDLLTLLNIRKAENNYKALVPFDPDERRGSWLDVCGVRIYGIKYHGAATARILEDVAGQIEPGPNGYTIMMLHAGLEGQVPHMHGGLTMGQLDVLWPAVDYLALGHVHKRVTVEKRVFNPGSTEVNSMDEMDWPHGFFDVSVDTDSPEKHVITEVETPTLRPFRRIGVHAEDSASVDDFIARVERKVAETHDVPEKAVIELHLGGVAEFRRQDVPVDRLKGLVQARFNPLVVRVRNNLAPPGTVHVKNQERLSRAEVERQIIERLVYQNAEYRDRAASWARLIMDVKNMAVEKDIPANIADHVMRAMEGLGAEAPEEDIPSLPEPLPTPGTEEPWAVPAEIQSIPAEFEDW